MQSNRRDVLRVARDRTLNQSLRGLAFLGGLSLPVFVFRGLHTNFKGFWLSLLGVLLLVFGGLFARRLRYSWKLICMCGGLSLLAFNGLLRFGVFAAGDMLMIIVIFFIAVLDRLRTAFWFIAFYGIVYFGLAFSYTLGWLELVISPALYAPTIIPWFLEALAIAAVTFVIISATQAYQRALAHQIDDLKEKHMQLLIKEKRYKALFEHSNNAILILADTICVDCNVIATQLFGLSHQQLFGKNLEELSAVNFRKLDTTAQLNAYFEASTQVEASTFSWTFERGDGQFFYAEVRLKRVNLDEEAPLYQVAIRDITVQRQAEEALRAHREQLEALVEARTRALHEANQILEKQRDEKEAAYQQLKAVQAKLVEADKMTSLGTLMTGIAHEVNNPLNFIQGSLYALEEVLKNEDNLQRPAQQELLTELLGTMQTGIDRVATILHSLGQITQRASPYLIRCDLHEIIENCLLIFNHNLKGRITVLKHYADMQLWLMGHKDKLHELFMNIFSNAIDAMENTKVKELQIRTKLNPHSNEIFITISDTGLGIKSEDLPHIFEPFFTTKSPGDGTGLGLSIVYNIIKEFGGDIQFKQANTAGTEVHIRLPQKKEHAHTVAVQDTIH